MGKQTTEKRKKKLSNKRKGVFGGQNDLKIVSEIKTVWLSPKSWYHLGKGLST